MLCTKDSILSRVIAFWLSMVCRVSVNNDFLEDSTVVPNKSDSDVMLRLQFLSKTLTCTLHLSMHESIDHLCINPILWIGLMHR